MKCPNTSRHGFTVTELLVVIGVIILLLGLLFPALGSFRRGGLMTKSMSNMRQIATWMTLYSGDNRDHVVPSQFNYSFSAYPGNVRSHPNPPTSSGVFGDPSGEGCGQHCGTWTDILWAEYAETSFPEAAATLGYDYRYDSPDVVLHELMGDNLDNVFRSAAPNSRNSTVEIAGGGQSIDTGALGPRPFGAGAREAGLPGYFAANNYFNADPASPGYNGIGFITTVQLRIPARSMYLVDSFAGEVIDPTPEDFQVAPYEGGLGGGDDDPTAQVDFRYNDMCLMLFLDGHIETVGKWDEICDLEGPGGLNIRIRDLKRRTSPCP